MQTYVYMDNYRGFADALVPLRKVNFLVGENSTGKSSFLDLIKLFYEFQFWYLEPSFHLTKVEQRHFLDLVSASSSDRSFFTVGTVEIDDGTGSPKGLIVTFRDIDGRPSPKRVTIICKNGLRTIDVSMKSKSKTGYWRRSTEDFELNKTFSDAPERIREFIENHQKNDEFSQHEINSQYAKAPFHMKFTDFLEGPDSEDRGSIIPSIFQRSFVDMAPIRTKPRRTYDSPQTAFSPEGAHTPYVVKRVLSKKTGAQFRSFLKSVGGSSGLFDSLSVKEFGSDPLAPFEIRINLGAASLGLQNVGYGVSQALPVLVEAFVRPRGHAFAIQQPEVHLHPRAQAAVGDVIANLARDDEKVFFIETHSDFTIDRFRLNLRKDTDAKAVVAETKSTEAEKVDISGQTDNLGSSAHVDENSGDKANVGESTDHSQILFFERRETGNHATQISIFDNGAMSDEQPESYRDFFLNESLALL